MGQLVKLTFICWSASVCPDWAGERISGKVATPDLSCKTHLLEPLCRSGTAFSAVENDETDCQSQEWCVLSVHPSRNGTSLCCFELRWLNNMWFETGSFTHHLPHKKRNVRFMLPFPNERDFNCVFVLYVDNMYSSSLYLLDKGCKCSYQKDNNKKLLFKKQVLKKYKNKPFPNPK